MLCSAHSGALLPRQIRSTSSSRKSTCNGCDTGDLFARSQRPPFVLQTTARIWGHPAGDRHSSGVCSAGRGRSLSAPITDIEVALVAAPEASAASRRLAEPLAKFCGTAIPKDPNLVCYLCRAVTVLGASATIKQSIRVPNWEGGSTLTGICRSPAAVSVTRRGSPRLLQHRCRERKPEGQRHGIADNWTRGLNCRAIKIRVSEHVYGVALEHSAVLAAA